MESLGDSVVFREAPTHGSRRSNSGMRRHAPGVAAAYRIRSDRISDSAASGFSQPCVRKAPQFEVNRPLLLLALCFIACSWYCTLRRRDAWPFTGYPMFENAVSAEAIQVYRIALEFSDGECVWWHPQYYKLQQTLGTEYARTLRLPPNSRTDQLSRLSLKISYFLSEDSGAEGATAFRIICRRPVRSADGTWGATDELVARISLPPLRKNDND
jgi:hypothetical protein